MSGSYSGLCAANRTDFGRRSDCKEEVASGNTLYYALFILGMVVAGAGCTPMIALGIPYMDENVSSKVSPMYVGIFFASGISGELSQLVSDIYDTRMIHNNHLFYYNYAFCSLLDCKTVVVFATGWVGGRFFCKDQCLRRRALRD